MVRRRHRFGLTVGHLVHSPGAVVDGYETGETWADPVPIEDCAVGWGRPDEPFEANREGVDIQFTVYGPPGWLPQPKDRIKHPSYPVPFDVVGFAKDWSVNPINGRPGGVEVLCGRFDG